MFWPPMTPKIDSVLFLRMRQIEKLRKNNNGSKMQLSYFQCKSTLPEGYW